MLRASPPAVRLIPTDRMPEVTRAALRAAVTPRSRVARVSLAAVRKAAPAGVRSTPRLVRWSSRVPTASSSFLTWELSTCWATWTCSAAAVKLSSSATATKYLRCRSSMFIASSSYEYERTLRHERRVKQRTDVGAAGSGDRRPGRPGAAGGAVRDRATRGADLHPLPGGGA